jgi:hypothetical protein
MATALLVVLTHPAEGKEDEYNRWYSEDHLDDVLTAAGFDAARRFRFVPSKLSRKPVEPYLAIYEVDADRREEAEALLLKTANTEAMPISDALGQPAVTWWFESITDRVERAASAAEVGAEDG